MHVSQFTEVLFLIFSDYILFKKMALKHLIILIVTLGVTVSKSVFARPEASSYLVLPEASDNLKEYADNYYDEAATGNAEYMKQALTRYPMQKPVHYPQKWMYPAPQNQIIDRGTQKIYHEKVDFKPQELVKPVDFENVVTDKRTSNSCEFFFI